MKRTLLLLPMLLLACIISFAQQVTVTGSVTNGATKLPLKGVTVSARTKSTVTDEEGKFSLKAKVGETIVLSFVGMNPITIKITDATKNLDITMDEAYANLDSIVVTGYQTQKKADLTGAVAVVNTKEIKDIPDGNPMKALQGRVPGVYITTDGTPTGQASILIRGIGTLNNNSPLYVIDGVPSLNTMEQLNPSDIESIQILKDASSASIYGSRAAHGVIVITTKRAKKGENKVQVDASTSVNNYNSKLDVLDANGYGKAYFQAAVNSGTDPNSNQVYQFNWNKDFTNPVLNSIIYPTFIDPAKTMKPANTNWFNEIAQTSITQQYNITITNGNERGSSALSIGYFDNKGVLKTTGTQKPTVRFNSEYNYFGGKLKVGENFTASYLKNAQMYGFAPSDVIYAAMVQQPVVPVHTVTGGWGGPAPGMSDRQNPVRLLEDNSGNAYNFYRVLGNVFADLEIIPKLHFRTSLALDFDGNYQRIFQKSYTSGFLNQPFNMTYTGQGYDINKIWQNTFNYDLALGKSKLQFLLGQEATLYNNQSFWGSKQGYAIESPDYAYLDDGSSNAQNGGNGYSWGLNSYFGKGNYVYDNKYLASVTIRRDGSSRFGPANQYATFPAFSLGWRVSEEKFMKNQSLISDLKLRYSNGTAGNQNFPGNYGIYSLYAAVYGTDPTWNSDQGTAYAISGNGTGQLPSGFATQQTGNDSLKWESTHEVNYGVDFGLFKNKITGSVDYFVRNTTGILIEPAYIAVLGGGGSHWYNGASMENKGIEILLNYKGQISHDLSFDLTANFSSATNKVTSLPADVVGTYPGNGSTKTILGRDITSFYGYEADGLFKSQQDVTSHATQVGAGIGRIRYKDLNGDGTIDQNDQDYIGKNTPDGIYGFNAAFHYKNFDFSFFFQGVAGITVYNNYKSLSDFTSLSAGTNWGKRTLDAYSAQNPNSNIPALTLNDNNNEGRMSTYFLESGSYLKLRNVQLAYNLTNVVKRAKVIKNTRIFIQGSNLLTIKSKSFTAKDPENPNFSFPIPIVGTIGLNVTL
jgi:TonB-linked SusC/RagA family outer membrane protein